MFQSVAFITYDGNLNLHYIWQNKAMNFLQIFKGQRLIIVPVLDILYSFEAIRLIIFLYLQYLGSFKFIDSFFWRHDWNNDGIISFTQVFIYLGIAWFLRRKRIFRNTISFHQSETIFRRILFHITTRFFLKKTIFLLESQFS